uniref:Uncharacterized protein n=1 Tax=Candidatus Kentrum sp. MB TaxID=2138164 RepID=A0A450XV34_9GAMM|nr:MAG: hypothetical protein BECKMB1821G_GA0114241_11392 [Candidatus Kentron sp. MB]VFK77661.1 MAG: hypothetical protein BECKMB1821H_GA0114242_12043 [Candidatus Kentron sp. MB]
MIFILNLRKSKPITPRKGYSGWSRPMPETGTSVNGGNCPPRGNGEGVAMTTPLPASEISTPIATQQGEKFGHRLYNANSQTAF